MKKYLTFLILLAACCTDAMAQQGDNPFSLGFNIIVPEHEEPIPASAQLLLKDRIGRLLTTNGMGSTDPYGRFIMAPMLSVLDKRVIRTGQGQTLYQLSLTLYAGDRITKTRFASFNVELEGVDRSDDRAMLAAIRQFNINSEPAKAFIAELRQKVAAHYNTDCDKNITLAKANADGRKFEEALALLASVPEDASTCYQRASQAMIDIHRQYIDHQCQVHLSKARAAVAAQDFETAVIELSAIYSDAACFADAKQLAAQVKARVEKMNDREFDLEFKKGFELENQRIAAARDVGVAFGENQKPLIQADTNIEDDSWLWW